MKVLIEKCIPGCFNVYYVLFYSFFYVFPPLLNLFENLEIIKVFSILDMYSLDNIPIDKYVVFPVVSCWNVHNITSLPKATSSSQTIKEHADRSQYHLSGMGWVLFDIGCFTNAGNILVCLCTNGSMEFHLHSIIPQIDTSNNPKYFKSLLFGKCRSVLYWLVQFSLVPCINFLA